MKKVFADIIKTAIITAVLRQAMNLADKKEYSTAVGIGGMSIIGVHCVKAYNEVMKDPPTMVVCLGKLFDACLWLLGQ